MMTMNDFRRGYDDRYDAVDVTRYGRATDPRWSHRSGGDWLRESPWLGDSSTWGRESAWLRESPSRLGEWNAIEVVAQSAHSWEDAARRAFAEASRNVRGVRSLWIEEMYAVADEELGLVYRIHARVSFAHRR